jgi:hypothetical protein
MHFRRRTFNQSNRPWNNTRPTRWVGLLMCYRIKSPQKDMSPPLGHIILTQNQPVVTTYKYDARLAKMPRLSILKSSVWTCRFCLKRCSAWYSPTSPMNCCRSYVVFMKPVIVVHQYCTTPVFWHGVSHLWLIGDVGEYHAEHLFKQNRQVHTEDFKIDSRGIFAKRASYL